MESGDVTQLFQVLEDVQVLIESVISGAFLLTGVLVGVLMMFIFFFFLKGAE
ncbi:MAG: hypothetical protein GX295_00625 [Syntrophomonadaceae bacterium]|nr:hypothetical protein [Syntrophomonadaceae bacterium]